jgi:hypothetical protein
MNASGVMAQVTSEANSRRTLAPVTPLVQRPHRHRECFTLFPDEMFADLFTDVGRRSVPPTIVAVVMVLQRIEGCSDREAVDRFAFDARWKYAAGGLDFDYPGFVHTMLVDMRARLASSARPDRIFEVTLEAARKVGLVTARPSTTRHYWKLGINGSRRDRPGLRGHHRYRGHRGEHR